MSQPTSRRLTGEAPLGVAGAAGGNQAGTLVTPGGCRRRSGATRRGLALSLAAGGLSVAGFAPLELFPLVWLALALLFVQLGRLDDWRAGALHGFAFGLGAFLGGVSWVYVSLHQFGGLAAPLAALATLLFCGYLALFPALAGAVSVGLARDRGGLVRAVVFAGAWTLAEWLRGSLFTGFPWLLVGYAQTPPSPLAGYAPVLGVYGVSLVTALLGAALGGLGPALVARRPGRVADWTAAADRLPRAALWVAVLLPAVGAALLGVRWTEPAGAPLRVALLQGNVEQDMKWRPERFADSLQAYHDLMQGHPARLTVLPETALPAYYVALPPDYLRRLAGMARAQDGDLLLGAVTGDETIYRNSVVSLGSAPRQVYSKRHLVPFGEFVPPGFAWFMGLLNIPMSGFTPGPAAQPPLAVAGQRVAMNICYEDVFGEELRGAIPAATMLANVSNTAWFGRSLAQPQHLQIARVRALESGRPMLRATNTGMTAVVTPDGRVQAALAPFTRAALVTDVQGMQGVTPFVRWGNGPALVLALLCLLTGAAGCFVRPATGRPAARRTVGGR